MFGGGGDPGGGDGGSDGGKVQALGNLGGGGVVGLEVIRV